MGVVAVAALVLGVDTVHAVVAANRIGAGEAVNAEFLNLKPYIVHTGHTLGRATGRVHTDHTLHREGTYRVHTGHTLGRTGTYKVHTAATPHVVPNTDVVEHPLFDWITKWVRSS